MNKLLGLIAFSVLLLAPVAAQNAFAATVTDANDIPEPSDTVDFSQFTGDFSANCPDLFSVNFCFSPGPIQIGDLVSEDIVWTGNPVCVGNNCDIIGNGAFSFGANGGWDSGRNGYIGTNNPPSVMRIEFNDASVCAVGGFVNHGTGPQGAMIIAYDSSNIVIETFDFKADAPISTPGGSNDGAFRGILRGTSDIAAIELSPGSLALDDLKFSRNCQIIGGELLPIDSTALLLAGAQSTSWMIPVTLSILGIGLFVVSRKSENS